MEDFKYILRTKGYFLCALIVLKIVLDYSYAYYVHKYFNYMGFTFNPDNIKIVESYLLLFLTGVYFSHKVDKPSKFYILFFYLLLIVPSLSLYPWKDTARPFLYMMISSLMLTKEISRLPAIKLPTVKNGKKIVLIGCMCFFMIIFAWVFARGGHRYINFNFFKVYEVRRIVASVIFPGKLSYLMMWFAKVINPCLMVMFIYYRKKMSFVLSLVAQVLFFSITAHKAILFYPVLVIFVCLFRNGNILGNLMLSGLSLVSIFSNILFYFTGKHIASTLFIRRALFVTVDNHFRYFDVFNDLGFLYMKDKAWVAGGKLYPYIVPIPLLLSKIYYGHTKTWINSGYLANGYMNFGYMGMILYSIILGFILVYMDNMAKKIPSWVVLGMTVVPMFSLLSADLLTNLISHGLLLSLIIVWFFAEKNYKGGIYNGRN